MDIEAFKELFNLEESYWWFVGRRNIAFTLLEKHVRKSLSNLVLDAGCGTGLNATILKERVGPTIGLDISDKAIGLARLRGVDSLVRASIEALPFKDGSFHLVSSFGVIYHQDVVDFRRAVGEFNRVCKNGGFVLITTPAFRFLRSRHDILQKSSRRLTRAELREAVSGEGFKIKKLSYWTFFMFPPVLAERVFLNLFDRVKGGEIPPESDLKKIPKILNKILVKIMGLEARLLEKLDFPFGVSLLCLGRKSA